MASLELAQQEARAASWQRFVISHGRGALLRDLAFILGREEGEIDALRKTGACAGQGRAKGHGFAELFRLWHGREPQDHEWRAPVKIHKSGAGFYEWLQPELKLLVTLVGQKGPAEISEILTARLRQVTGDKTATRNRMAVQVRINQIGLQTSDVVGGITLAEAAKEYGALAPLYQAIERGDLQARMVGRQWVIPHRAWQEWMINRAAPPQGFVKLATLKQPLGILSDKLSEFARMGYVPSAVRCRPYGANGPSTQFGTWWIPPQVADQLVEDRRAGRPMPWHGKPLMDNLRVTWRLWCERKHPDSCPTCAAIWGELGAPQDFDEYVLRYPPLAHGAKRHLTMVWTPGLTIPEVAEQAGCSAALVRRAIANGVLKAERLEPAEAAGSRRRPGRPKLLDYVSRTDATLWISRKCPTGESSKSWVSLDTACKLYLFTLDELKAYIADGTLLSKVGTAGAMRGITYVPKHQCGQLRAKLGFTQAEAAKRLGVSVEHLREMLDESVSWRAGAGEGIPLAAIQTLKSRMESRCGRTIDEAAMALRVPSQWVKDRVEDGTIKLAAVKWNPVRLYISEPMFDRLIKAKVFGVRKQRELDPDEWLLLSAAAQCAGVSSTMICIWVEQGSIERRPEGRYYRYSAAQVRERAREYWKKPRLRRAVPPQWLQDEARAMQEQAALV